MTTISPVFIWSAADALVDAFVGDMWSILLDDGLAG